MSASRPYWTPEGQVVSQARQVRQRSRCNCVLAVGGGGKELVPLHAAVAAACSPTLRSTLRWDIGTVVWRGQQLRRMTVPASAAAVRALVGFVYTGVLQLGVGVEDVAEVWSAADYLQMGSVTAACEAHVRGSNAVAGHMGARERAGRSLL